MHLFNQLLYSACAIMTGCAAVFGASNWESETNKGLQEAREGGKLLIRISRQPGYGYRQIRALNSPGTKELMGEHVLLSGVGHPMNSSDSMAQTRLKFSFYSWRGDYLGDCVPHNETELCTKLTRILSINALLKEAETAPDEEKLSLLKEGHKLLGTQHDTNLPLLSTYNRLGHEIGALSQSPEDYYHRYHNSVLNYNLLLSDLYNCGENAAAILRKIDEIYGKCTREQRRELLYIKIFMLLALAKTDEDVYNIGKVYKQYNTMRHENEPRVSCIALDDPEALLRDKQIRDSSSGEMLVKNELSFSERYLKRRSAPPSSHSTYKPYGTERVERRWDIGFDFLQDMVERGELYIIDVDDALEKMGIEFPPSSRARYNFNINALVVTSTLETLDKIDALVSSWKEQGQQMPNMEEQEEPQNDSKKAAKKESRKEAKKESRKRRKRR